MNRTVCFIIQISSIVENIYKFDYLYNNGIIIFM